MFSYKKIPADELWRATGRWGEVPGAKPRISFFCSPPDGYEALNGRAPRRVDREGSDPKRIFRENCGHRGTLESVKVLDFPSRLPTATLEQAAEECRTLRSRGSLTVMRGDRPTDLLRPLSPDLAERVRSCPALRQVLEWLEGGDLAGSGLFVRSIKFDDARASSTARDPRRLATHLHFDAERATPKTFSGSIRQFYLNLSSTPRHFLIVPVALEEMLAAGEHPEEPVGGTLERFLDRFGTLAEVTAAPPFSLVVFDGRAFAHDAAKFEHSSFLDEGAPLELAREPDFIVALDALETNYEHVGYRPEAPFLEDVAAAAG
ncbi:MAG: hypothetical protein AAF725_00070 [Acidobacteriota bacterium]